MNKLERLIAQSFIILMLFMPVLGYGQESCLTSTSAIPAVQDLITPRGSLEDFNIKVYFHVVRQSDGTGGVTPSQVEESYGILNQDFNPHGVFFIWNECIDYIDSDYFWNQEIIGDLWWDDEVMSINSHSDGVDVYIYQDDSKMAVGKRNSDPIQTSFWVGGTGGIDFETPNLINSRSSAVSHEMGHVLSLLHTHTGTCLDPGIPEDPSGVDCDITGDYICDTPADPNIWTKVNGSTCVWLGLNFCNWTPFPLIEYNPNSSLIMSYTSVSCMTEFTHGQVSRMKTALMSFPYLQSIQLEDENICGCKGGDDIHINSNVIMDANVELDADIYVHTGGHLTITSTIEFDQGKGIIVERGGVLHIDGGALTKCPEINYWAGIHVEGNYNLDQPISPFILPQMDEAGIVLVENGGSINWAIDGISTHRRGQSWKREYWGGLVYCTDAYFFNNRRAVEFMKYDLDNNSRFINCIFKDDVPGENKNSVGVSIWDTDDIEFDNCDFLEMDNHGILIWDAGCVVKNGCYFTGNKVGIGINATSPLSSGDQVIIEPRGNRNLFEGNDERAIDVRSGVLYKNVNIVANDFKDTHDEIWIDGFNSTNVRFNYFKDVQYPLYGQFTQDGINEISCNDMKDGIIDLPIYFEGWNHQTTILENVMKGELTDWALVESSSTAQQGTLYGFQGEPDAPAKNCFSPAIVEDIWTYGNTQHFNYFVPLNPQPCDVPQPSLFTNNYTTISTFDFSPSCPVRPGRVTDTICDVFSYFDLVDSLTLAENQLSNNPTNLDLQFKVLDLEQAIEGIIACLIRADLDDGEISTSETLLSNIGDLAANKKLFGLHLNTGDLVQAQTILNAISDGSQENLWFKRVMQLRLDLETDPENFSLTALDITDLDAMAHSEWSERGYARSLLMLLNDSLYNPILNIPALPISQGSKEDIDQLHTEYNTIQDMAVVVQNTLVIPPASRPVNGFLSDTSEELILYNLSGTPLRHKSRKSDERASIDMNNVSSGMYILQILDGGKTEVYRQKIIYVNE